VIGLPIICVWAIIPVALVFLALATRDLDGASQDDYDSAIGYDKPIGWVWTLLMLAVLIVLMGAAGAGPLAGSVTVVH